MAPARTPDGTAALPPATPEQERSLQLAKGLVLSGSCSDAVPHLEAILAGPPTVAKVAALPLLGDCYRTTGRLQETIAAYERARALLPGVAEVAAALGRAYLEAGREEDAVATLRQAIKLRPRLLQAHLDQAEALRRLGRPEEAADCQHEYERQVAEASEELRAPDVQARLLAVETLSQAREELAAMGLVTALADEDPRVRTLAATALAVSRSHLALEGLRGRLPEELAPQVLTALRQAIAAQEQAVGNPAAPPTPPSPRPTIRPTPRRRPATPPPQAGSGGDLPSRLGSPRP
jgi:tetratricopeptide (TPR) repeat protein